MSGPRFRSMWKITKQNLNKSIQSTWKWLIYSSEKFLCQPNAQIEVFNSLEWYYIISVVLECHMLKYPPSKLLCRIPNFYLMWHSTRKIACYILYIHATDLAREMEVCMGGPTCATDWTAEAWRRWDWPAGRSWCQTWPTSAVCDEMNVSCPGLVIAG